MLNIKNTIDELSQIGIENPRLEAEILLEYCNENNSDLQSLINKRKSGVPLCKIVGHKGFYKHDFIVSEDVLSPRSDTEVLVEKAIEILQDKIENSKILELGVGSGCILLSILSDIQNASGVGVDISSKALEITKQNIKKLELEDKVETICSSWFDEDLLSKLSTKFDMIVSNPPYISSSDVLSLDDEVKKYDPLLALDGGIDGLRDYKQIAKISKYLLKKGGVILLEVGIFQYKDVISIFENQSFELVSIIKDLSNVERCLLFTIY